MKSFKKFLTEADYLSNNIEPDSKIVSKLIDVAKKYGKLAGASDKKNDAPNGEEYWQWDKFKQKYNLAKYYGIINIDKVSRLSEFELQRKSEDQRIPYSLHDIYDEFIYSYMTQYDPEEASDMRRSINLKKSRRK